MVLSIADEARRSLVHDGIADIILADLIKANLGGLDYIPSLRAKVEFIAGGGENSDAIAKVANKIVDTIEGLIKD